MTFENDQVATDDASIATEGSEATPPAANRTANEIKVDYVRSNFFRIVHADGVWGGVTPRLDVHMAFWSSGPPTPRQITYKVDGNGALKAEVATEQESQNAQVREVETGIIMDLNVAKSFRAWLDDKIVQAERMQARLQAAAAAQAAQQQQ